MDINQSNNGGQPQAEGAGQKKQKKNHGRENTDNTVEQPKTIQGQQKTHQKQPNFDNKQKQKEMPKEAKLTNSSEDGQESKDQNAADNLPTKEYSSTGNQQIEQHIAILKNSLSIPKRKNPKLSGTKGRATEVEVNYLPLNIDNLCKKIVYHIDVQFNPEMPKRLLRTALEEFNRKNYPNVHWAFDGRRNMYTTKDLRGKTDIVSILNEENNQTIDFTIVTSTVNVIAMNKIKEYLRCGSSNNTSGEAFQALDIILKNRPFSLRFTNIGRSFFPVPRITPIDLGEGMELWKGFFQSPVMGWKPYLNIDVSNKGFPKHQPLTEYISNELKCDLNKEMQYSALNSLSCYVKGLKVDYMIPNQHNTKRSYKVVGLLDTAANFTFEMNYSKEKKNITVAQYYKVVRNYNVKYPNLPCLHVGSIAKKTAIPIELCTVQKGQLKMSKLTENQTASMVKYAVQPPVERKKTIENCIRDIKFSQDPVLKEFGVEVQEKFYSIPARVLAQPTLAYNLKEITPKAGIWKPERFSKAAQLKRWIVLNLDPHTNMTCIKEFEKMLIESGKELNVFIQPMIPVITVAIPKNFRQSDIVQWVATTYFGKLKNLVDLVVVIIPEYPAGVYAAVKQASELQIGILTQCIKSKTMYKMNKPTSINILFKINSKLNGINHTLAIKSSPSSMEGAIIFGADVTHPSPDQINIPSVAAVAASHDLRGSQYNMEFRLQSPKVEIIKDLEDIVHKQLLKFREKTKTIPKKIFYFRDGVSEGQFLQLLEHELISIRRACLRLNVSYKPPVTFLVVQKRHHTRMFSKYNIDMDGKFNNIPSGTVIDTQITHPTELDFYLCSHASIQGTSRPTKYHLIWDDSNFTEDQIEELTFYLCFMFVRCTRSVSYPAPTYYAHLAAFRARSYIENKVINLNRLDEEQAKNKLENSFSIDTPMFFI